MTIEIKLPNGRMSVNLDEFYPASQQDSKKLMKIIRNYRHLNEDTYNYMVQYFRDLLSSLEKGMEIICENYACQRLGTKMFKQYEREFKQCQRLKKLYEASLRVLTEGK